MSWSFPCTPCGFDHAGECEVLSCGCKGRCKGDHGIDLTPSPASPHWADCKGGCGRRTAALGGICSGCQRQAAQTPQQPQVTQSGNGWTATIAVGSRWRLMHNAAGSQLWAPAGYQNGYEVMAVVANGFMVAIQMREWAAPAYPVYTCSLKWWEPDGSPGVNGGFNRFDPY